MITESVRDSTDSSNDDAASRAKDGCGRRGYQCFLADELEEKIEKTGELIDKIVYELYGLTDEEIEIVEEAVAE